MNILGTGGIGLIDSNLALRFLQEGYQVSLRESMISEHRDNQASKVYFIDQVCVSIGDVSDLFATSELLKDFNVIYNFRVRLPTLIR